jgi:tRNA (guanine10-N2)-methyltransferase
MENVKLEYDAQSHNPESPYLIIGLQSHQDAQKLIQRSFLIKNIIELWTESETIQGLMENIRNGTQKDRPEYQTCSFKFQIRTYGLSLSSEEQMNRIQQFAWLDYKGPIKMKNPDVQFVFYEEYDFGSKTGAIPKKFYFGVQVAEGTGNEVVAKYDLKKRQYLGTTSMDAELSLITANQALARPGSIIYDPFVGTGSFLVSCSHFGAYTLGSDIDGRKIRGNDGKGINQNLSQYKMESKVLGTLACDIAHHCWRNVPLFDAIVCDPPYGVREGAKKITYTDMPAIK